MYFWGDLARERITYVRNYVFRDINVLKVNPAMPYHDPRRPYVNRWFSSSDGNRVETFNALLSPENLDQLEQEGGVCIVYTHFSRGFVDADGQVNAFTRARLEDLASRPGYFVPVHQMLDLLEEQGSDRPLFWRDRVYLQGRWFMQKVIHGAS